MDLIINSKSGLTIKSIAGKKLSSIDLSGSDLEIFDLCSLIKREKLGSLNRFHIENAKLVNFNTSQLEGCYDSNSKSPSKQLEVCINCFRKHSCTLYPDLIASNILYIVYMSLYSFEDIHR